CNGETIAPPQKCRLFLCKDIAHPQLESTADSPPTILFTTAHCVTNSTNIIRNAAVVTAIDKLSQSTLSTAQVRSIVNVSSHPNYNDDSKVNDIAVLRLDRPLTISYEGGTARLCVPRVVPMNMSNKYPVSDSSLVAIGWGVLASGSISIPSNLHLQQV
ncbi:unnamed protein product, partial [Rotaria sordida]